MCKKRQGMWKKPWANPSHDISEAKKAHRAVLLLFAGEERKRERRQFLSSPPTPSVSFSKNTAKRPRTRGAVSVVRTQIRE
jgi:hypothetical protein